MSEKLEGLKEGTACFLVKDKSLLRVLDDLQNPSSFSEFYAWLCENGYRGCGGELMGQSRLGVC